jgi:hypothetical protein
MPALDSLNRDRRPGDRTATSTLRYSGRQSTTVERNAGGSSATGLAGGARAGGRIRPEPECCNQASDEGCV